MRPEGYLQSSSANSLVLLEIPLDFPIGVMADDRIVPLEKNRVLIGCTGSVASIKIPMLIEQLSKSKYKVCFHNAFIL